MPIELDIYRETRFLRQVFCNFVAVGHSPALCVSADCRESLLVAVMPFGWLRSG